MKIFTIFLDFEGVINKVNTNDEFLDLKSLEIVYKLVEFYDAQVVIISSYGILTLDNLERQKLIKDYLSQKTKLNMDYVSTINPYLEPKERIDKINYTYRGLGIIDYINKNNIKDYVIIDDSYDDEYQKLNLNYYKVDGKYGLREEDFHKIIHHDYSIKQLPKVEHEEKRNLNILKKQYIKKKI